MYGQGSVFFTGGNICQTDSWKLVYYDEFNGTSLDVNKWYRYYPYGANNSDQCEPCRTHGSNEDQIYSDNNVIVSNGTLKLVAKKETSTWFGSTRNHTSGIIHSQINNFKYGKYEIRCKIPSGAGFWPAFWTFGGGDEIDVFEFGGQNPNKIYTSIHQWFTGYSNFDTKSFIGPDYSQNFHTYAVEWDNYFIKWYVDGSLIRSESKLYTSTSPVTSCNVSAGTYIVNPLFPTGEQSVICNLAIGNSGSPSFVVPPNSSTVFPNQLEVDYIRIYQRTPQNGFTNLCQINGPSIACNGSQYVYQFSDSNNPVASWSVSSNLTVITSNSNSITVQVNSSVNANAQITANFATGNACGTSVVKNIAISSGIEGVIYSSNYNGSMQTTNNIGTANAQVNVTAPGANSFTWVKTSGAGNFYPTNNGQSINLYNLGSISLSVSANTSNCGTLSRTVAFFNYSSFYSIYPNPASSLVTIEGKDVDNIIDYTDVDGKNVNKKIKIAIESVTLYDELGNSVKKMNFTKNNKVAAVDIKNLKAGVYYVEVANDEYKFREKIIKQ